MADGRVAASAYARRRIGAAAVLVVVVLLAAVAITALTGGEGADSARATGPRVDERPRVALQVGHWRHEELPGELRWVRASAGGATAGGVVEWQTNFVVAREAARLLRRAGVAAELVPATVRPGYRAAAFVSIHADGNRDTSIAGFKAAPSAADRSRLSSMLTDSIVRRYGERTRLSQNSSVTADMTGYYAFDARRFRHAIDPATPAVVLETGFLSSPEDRRVIVDQPRIAAAGIADGVVDFLRKRTAPNSLSTRVPR